jgi:diamine N-acetyltransferase
MSVRLEPVTQESRQTAIALDIADEQRHFLETESISHFLADAPSHTTFRPHLIFNEDVAVGFVSFGYVPEDPSKWWIPLIIVDQRYQGNGYARAALSAIIADLRERVPGCQRLGLSYKPDNKVAENLYASLGFTSSGEGDGEIEAWLEIRT